MSNAIQVPFMKKPILCRDLSNRYAQLRRSYYASSAYGNVDEEEEIELHYSPSTNLNSGAAKDMESGMDQQWAEGTSPLWYRVLTQVKIDIDSIKKYSKFCFCWHDWSRFTFKHHLVVVVATIQH